MLQLVTGLCYEVYTRQDQKMLLHIPCELILHNIVYVICIVTPTLPGSLRIAVTFRSKEKFPRLSIEATTWKTTLILGLAVSN